jgi:hypothetical protein
LPGHQNACWVVSSKLDMFLLCGSFKILVLRLMFCGLQFSTIWNEHQAVIETWHVFMLVCSRTLVVYACKPALGHLEASNTFTICCWNNIGVNDRVHQEDVERCVGKMLVTLEKSWRHWIVLTRCQDVPTNTRKTLGDIMKDTKCTRKG